MKKVFLSLVLFGVKSFAFDSAYVYKFHCDGGDFYGVPYERPATSSDVVTYNPVNLSGNFCKVFPGTMLSVSSYDTHCMGFSATKLNIPASSCQQSW